MVIGKIIEVAVAVGVVSAERKLELLESTDLSSGVDEAASVVEVEDLQAVLQVP